MRRATRIFLSVFATLLCAGTSVLAQSPAEPAKFPPEELEQLVAPIALYPDSLLAQIFMASTYPLEVVEAARWSKDHPDVKGEAVSNAVASQNWDPSVKSLVAFPDVLTMMNDKLDWTQKLGDAFLAQQSDVMDAVQRLRTRAAEAGNLKSTKEMTVTTEAAPAGAPAPQTIIIESPTPQVVYVPTYNPTVIYGPWPYPAYPPYYYRPPGYVAGVGFWSFTAGIIVGSALWGGCNWHHHDVDININRYNNFNHTNINVNNVNVRNRNTATWQHNNVHRRGVGYRDPATQHRYQRGVNQQNIAARERYRGRAEQARQQLARQGPGAPRDLSGKPISPGNANRNPGGAVSRPATAPSRPAVKRNPGAGPQPGGAFNGVNRGANARSFSHRGNLSRGGRGIPRR